MIEFKIIGLPDDEAARFLQSGLDVCFGKSYARTAPECIACRAAVISEGKVLLMKEVCSLTMIGALPQQARVNKLSSKQVLERLEQGATLAAIFAEILGDSPPEHSGATARQFLVDRLIYLRSLQPEGLPEKVPRLKDLLQELGR